MKQFISYDEMNQMVFPTDIQSENFVTMDEMIQDDSISTENLTGSEQVWKEITDEFEDNIEPFCTLEKAISDSSPVSYEKILPHSMENYAEYKRERGEENIKKIPQDDRYAQVRILNAGISRSEINGMVGNLVVCKKLPFGGVTSYTKVIDGYHAVHITDTESGTILINETLPFIGGKKVTIVLFSTAAGTDVSLVYDDLCYNQLKDKMSFRAANFSFDQGPFDVVLSNGCSIFTDIRMKEVTSFKQGVPGNYNFYLMDTAYSMISYPRQTDEREVPNYVIDFYIQAEKDKAYTSYIIGGFYSEVPLYVVTIED